MEIPSLQPHCPHIPDDLTLGQLLFDHEHAIRPKEKAGTPWLVEDATGRRIGKEEVDISFWSSPDQWRDFDIVEYSSVSVLPLLPRPSATSTALVKTMLVRSRLLRRWSQVLTRIPFGSSSFQSESCWQASSVRLNRCRSHH